jgi:hypothetical protein
MFVRSAGSTQLARSIEFALFDRFDSISAGRHTQLLAGFSRYVFSIRSGSIHAVV